MYTYSPTRFLGALTAACSLFVLHPGAALAQEPVRLPGVVVSAKPDPPGPKIFVGVVRDTFALPIEGVEITIPSLLKRTFSKADGTFRFEDVGRGTYSVRARKVGYGPQVRTFKIEKDGGTGEFALVPLPYYLPTVVSSAIRGGLSGTVADTGYNAVPDALVTVLGKSMHALTDSAGSFFIPAPPGSWMVSIKKADFAERVASVRIPDDSGRYMTTHLFPATEIPVREVWNVRDLEARQSWRNKITQPFYSREDIQKMGIVWIYDLVRAGGGDQFDADCYVAVNGGPTVVELWTLTVDDVESVEIYKATRFSKPKSMRTGPSSVPKGGRTPPPAKLSGIVPISNMGRADTLNLTRNCPQVYVWLR